MAKVPAIRNLNSLVKDLGKSVAPQKKLIDADIALNATAGRAQEEGLAATAQNTYGQIEQAAQDKGMFFSGFSPDEQAKYNSSTYLPALAQLQATIAGTRSQLLGKKADLDTNVFNKAFDTREGDIGRRFNFTERVEGQKFSRSERKAGQKFSAKQAAQERAFKSAESQKDRNAAAANAARASSGGGGPSPADVLDADRRAIATELGKKTGGDGYVSPGSYKTAKNAWTSSGYDAKTFDNYFNAYVNPYSGDKKNGATRSKKDYGL